MTDNRTTELLCKLLEERGLSCQTNYLHASWHVGPKLYEAMDNLDGTLTVDNLTPEQAIAATLGSGTLTAEQVSKAIYAHNIHAYYADDDWQAIADELNAELGSDDEYEAKMDALLCRLTNGKWSKTRAYDLDFIVSCVDEEYEELYEKERAELGSEVCE